MDDFKTRIAREVQARGTAHVSRVLDVNKGSLLSYLAGSAREGTTLLIESRANRLTADAQAAR